MEIEYTLDMPVHLVSRLAAEASCREAGMDMNKLMFMRWLNNADLLGHADHGMEFPFLDFWPVFD